VFKARQKAQEPPAKKRQHTLRTVLRFAAQQRNARQIDAARAFRLEHSRQGEIVAGNETAASLVRPRSKINRTDGIVERYLQRPPSRPVRMPAAGNIQPAVSAPACPEEESREKHTAAEPSPQLMRERKCFELPNASATPPFDVGDGRDGGLR